MVFNRQTKAIVKFDCSHFFRLTFSVLDNVFIATALDFPDETFENHYLFQNNKTGYH